MRPVYSVNLPSSRTPELCRSDKFEPYIGTLGLALQFDEQMQAFVLEHLHEEDPLADSAKLRRMQKQKDRKQCARALGSDGFSLLHPSYYRPFFVLDLTQ